jgi:hypothetical protein
VNSNYFPIFVSKFFRFKNITGIYLSTLEYYFFVFWADFVHQIYEKQY